jgi:protein N-lysine methyltransferase METTL21A
MPVSAPPSRSPSPPSENDIFANPDFALPPRTLKPAETTDLSFHGLLSPPLKLHEDLSEGCGGQLWPAGMTLARYMLTQHTHNLVGKHIMEIGAGGGLVGLAVAAGCELDNRLVLTDQEAMFALMEKNIAMNNLQDKIQAKVYDWGSKPPPTFASKTGHPDVVLAADCVYFEPAFPLLLETLKDLIGPDTTCYFCFKKRRKADMRFIKDMMRTFHVEEVDYSWRNEDRRATIFLYMLTRRNTH